MLSNFSRKCLVKVSTVRFSSSALLVPGRVAKQRFTVFSPQLDFDWIEEKREIVKDICLAKGIPLCIDKSISSWQTYKTLKSREKMIAIIVTGLDNEINSLKGDESKQAERLEFIEKRKSVKSSLNKLKEEIWDLEETDILSLLNLPNFSDSTPPHDEVISTFGKEKSFHFSPKSHVNLNLVEFSKNSHTSFYLRGKLALLEHKISQYFKQKLLSRGFDIMSNPDFTKTVIAECCGRTISDPCESFSLKPAQDFGDLSSLNAMHLVGGASLEPFAAFWCRQVLNNPRILPVNSFCVGRQYQPQPRGEDIVKGLFNTQQSQVIEMFSVSGSEEQMREQLGKAREAMDGMYKVLGHFRVVEVGVEGLSRSDCRAWSYQGRRPATGEWVELGRVRQQGEYLSRRMMMKQKLGAGEGGVEDLWTGGGTVVNVTKLIALLLEMHQDQQGKVDCDKLCQMFKC